MKKTINSYVYLGRGKTACRDHMKDTPLCTTETERDLWEYNGTRLPLEDTPRLNSVWVYFGGTGNSCNSIPVDSK